MLNIVVHVYNLSIQEARVEGVLQVQSNLTYTVLRHPGLHCETSSNTHVQEHMHHTHTCKQVKIDHLNSHRTTFLEDYKQHLWEIYESASHCKSNNLPRNVHLFYDYIT